MTAHASISAAANAQAAPRFSRPRFAFLVALGVYPLITGLLYLIFPLTEGWLLWQRTLLIVPIMVTAMVWGLIPGVQKHFRGFLNPQS
jgi:antibiotic biosynthesis monooxygenase (ABM) superfamily enzyme